MLDGTATAVPTLTRIWWKLERIVTMKLRAVGATMAILGCSSVLAAPTIVRVTPDTIPSHIEVSITAIECVQSSAPVAPWYATVSADLAEVVGGVSIDILLRDPETDEFLFNPGARAIIEGERVFASIAFAPGVLDQVVFQWREQERGNTIYEIYLADFYSGSRCS
jgi:hypothetical protein